MRVRRDFDAVYSGEEDPWSIGDADSERYNLYHDLISRAARSRSSMLDIGSGFGAFLARFRGEFEELTGLEVSELALRKGGERFPFVEFVHGSATDLPAALPRDRSWDCIVFSDVIYYLRENAKNESLAWIGNHLNREGLAFIAAWCPGGQYLTPRELERLVRRHLVLEESRVLESGHAMLIARPKRVMVALTVDYETWQPIPSGRTIDWRRDVFDPTGQLLDACDAEQAKVTLMAEMGEYFWLREHEPELARQMEAQWVEAIKRGHDVQLHLHPNWLPELGACRDGEEWSWDWSKARAHDFPGDLNDLVARCRDVLQVVLREADPRYEVTAFRAGAYEAQPFFRLHDALASNGIMCDTSVLPGGRHPDRHYDYSLAFSDHQPYFANRFDPQLKAPPAEHAVVEIPVFAPEPNQRWTFDSDESAHFADRLLSRLQPSTSWTKSSWAFRHQERTRELFGRAYYRLRRYRRWVNRLLPREVGHRLTSYGTERLTASDYYVLVGHTKSDLNIKRIREGIRRLRSHPHVELVTLTEAARTARAELARSVSANARAEAAYQVKRERVAVLSPERNETQSQRLQELIPLDRENVLDLGCGAGAWSARIAEIYPWMSVIGVDVGEEFIARARATYAGERVSFAVEDFGKLSFSDGTFDCVYADNSLEHGYDVQSTLAEAYRVLADGGVLVAAIPSDARNPKRVCDNHTWKTAPQDVRTRLEQAGFVGVELDEIDTYRALGMSPYPPSDDRMMYVRCWKRPIPAAPIDRADEIRGWVYRRLDPSQDAAAEDPIEILAGGHAWCAGYVVALGMALQREGFVVRWVTMLATDHPRGRGPRNLETHEVIELELPDGARHVIDAMANVRFPTSVDELMRHPELSDTDRPVDSRYQERGYELYATSFWYARIDEIAVRESPRHHAAFHPASRVLEEDWPPSHAEQLGRRALQSLAARLRR